MTILTKISQYFFSPVSNYHYTDKIILLKWLLILRNSIQSSNLLKPRQTPGFFSAQPLRSLSGFFWKALGRDGKFSLFFKHEADKAITRLENVAEKKSK